MPWITIVFFLAGLGGLWVGTELTIHSALELARRWRLSPALIGLTIVAIGTDLPELFMAVIAASHKLGGTETSGVLLGNAIGSCFAQISLMLGTAGLVRSLHLARRSWYRDGAMMVGSVVLVAIQGLDGEITRLEGASLLTIYAVYFVMLLREQTPRTAADAESPPAPPLRTPLRLIAGLAVLLTSSEIVIANAVSLAERLGLAQTFVGIIILAIGTSLPELALSLNAIRRGEPGLLVGNVIGSNIFDALVPIGTGALIATLSVERELVVVDLPLLVLLSCSVLLFLRTRRGLFRGEAIALIGFYLTYAAFKVAAT